jgi:chemotaxis protein methyltransferase CheR
MTVAIELIGSVLALDPLNAEAQFVRGLAELGAGDAQAATASLRRALYVRPNFWQAAFKLGRAQELGGDRAAAALAYKRVLRTLDRGDAEPTSALDPVAPADVAAACRLRLRALADHAATVGLPPAGRARR